MCPMACHSFASRTSTPVIRLISCRSDSEAVLEGKPICRAMVELALSIGHASVPGCATKKPTWRNTAGVPPHRLTR